MLEQLHDDLWSIKDRIRMPGGVRIPRRMAIVRLGDGGLWVHSPGRLTAERRQALDALGPVRHLVAPCLFHHFFLERWQEAYPEARLWAPDGLASKRPDLTVHEALPPSAPPCWADVIDQRPLAGAPKVGETEFYHRPSRTLLLADLAFCVGKDEPLLTRLLFRLNGGYGCLGCTRIFRWFASDTAAVRASAEAMLDAWEVERVHVSHGDPVEQDAGPALRQALARL